MGTINYMTSDYITLAIQPYDIDSIIKDPDFLEWMKESDYSPEEAEDLANEEIINYYDADRTNAETILDKYSFYYFHIAIKPGYYEGLSIDIENNFPVFFEDYRERLEALKELKEIQKALEELAGVGFIECGPGWCTSYGDYESTMAAIPEAIREIRDEIKSTPTYRQYNRETA